MLHEAQGALGRKALKVFRVLASQAFGGALDLEAGTDSDAAGEDGPPLERSISRTLSSNLHEQIVGLMYAEGHEGLSELQRSVFDMVFSEIEREAPALGKAVDASPEKGEAFDTSPGPGP